MNQYSTYTDTYLFQLLKTGDESAFTEIYNRYWEKLFFIAGTKLHDLHIAEELVQDIFLDLWNRRNEIVLEGELQSYLAVAMKYKVINAQAKINKANTYQQFVNTNTPLKHHDTENWLSFEELRKHLEKLVSQLPERCQLTYRLSREVGLSYREIAEELNISEKAVESNISRATTSLRAQLTQFLSSFLSLSVIYPFTALSFIFS